MRGVPGFGKNGGVVSMIIIMFGHGYVYYFYYFITMYTIIIFVPGLETSVDSPPMEAAIPNG